MSGSRVLLVIIGAGPAGLMAAISAAQRGLKPLLIEQNQRVGCKLLISGGGRCNITNVCESEEFLSRFGEYKNFFRHAFYNFSNRDAIRFFEAGGLELKEEERGKVFPKSGKSRDVVKFFERMLRKYEIEVLLECRVEDIGKQESGFIVKTNKGIFVGNNLVIATGGASFASKCGTRGDGFSWARKFGHTITRLIPHLCALNTQEPVDALKGITLKEVGIKHRCSKHRIDEIGSLIFTHSGLSGPVIHNVSRFLLDCPQPIVYVDLFPGRSFDEVRKMILDAVENHPNRKLKNILAIYQPDSLAKYVARLSSLEEKLGVQISKSELHRLITMLKALAFHIIGGPPLEWAFVTAGGVSLKEVNPHTMESRKVAGLYFAGEVLEPVGPSGGFNIQFALSTGWTAGKSVCRES